MDYFNALLPTIEHFRFLGYWIVFFILLIDSAAFIGLVSPGTLLAIGIGFLSAQGYLDIGDAIWFAAAGAILGDMLSYYVGKHVGEAFFKDDNKIFKAKYIKIGQVFFNKHGNKAIFLDRFIGPVRPIATLIAGMSQMDQKKFFFWSILSSFSWVITFLLIGYLFGQAWETVMLWSTRGSVFVFAFLFSIAALYVLKWFLVRNGRQLFAFVLSLWRSISSAVVENEDVKKFTTKHATLVSFIKARFDRGRFLGLPTTLLLSSFVYTGILFVGIVESVVTTDVITTVDTRVMNLLALFRNADLTQFFLWVTLLGTWQVVFGYIVAIVGVLWVLRKRLYILPLLVTVVGAELFTAVSKIVFHRPRPELSLYTEHSFSFPSGHATIAVAFYGFLVYLLIRNTTVWRTKINIFFGGIVGILLVGFSRLYLGVHYVSDVLGGYLVGALWLIIGISIAEWMYAKKKPNVVPMYAHTNAIVNVFFILAVSWYVTYGIIGRPTVLEQPQTTAQVTTIEDVKNIFVDEQMRYTETLIGTRQEPLSFIILAQNDADFIEAFTKAGWYLADPVGITSLAKISGKAIVKQQYLNAPMTPSFWNTETHTFGFEKPTDANNVRERHHARFWRTSYVTSDSLRVYVGTASLDVGIKWGVIHQIAPDIDTEREVLFSDLKQADVVQTYTKEPFVTPTLGENFSGDQFFTDGLVYTLVFR